MAESETAIVNRALDLLGADAITSLDDDVKSARVMKRAYAPVRDAVLRAYPWNCAMTRAALAADAAAPAWGYAYRYAWPSDCLRLWQVLGEVEGTATPYKIEGRYILTDDAAPLYVIYLKQLTDTAQFDPLLAEAISGRLAAECAYTFTGSSAAQDTAWKFYRDKIQEAWETDAQEGTPDEFTANQWLESRFNGSGERFRRIVTP